MAKRKVPKVAEKKPGIWRRGLEILKAFQLFPLVISLLIALVFYVLAGNDMLRETKVLKIYNNMILTFMEAIVKEKQGKMDLRDIDFDFEKNEKGEIVGWKIRKGTGEAKIQDLQAKGQGTVILLENKREPKKPESPR